MREQLLQKIQSQYEADSRVPPVVTLDEYFSGNTNEDCIAPNQLGYGRPPLAEMYRKFTVIQQKPSVRAVLVGIHDDWVEALQDSQTWPAAENIHIYTTASLDEVYIWIAGLAADGAIEGWPYGMHPHAPKPEPGVMVYSVCWD